MRTMMLGAMALAMTAAAARADEWGAYGRDLQGTRFSPLTQITPANVASLEPAWTYHTGDVSDGKTRGVPRSGFESTPLMLDGRLYLTTPFNRVIALDPATGRQLWAFDPKLDRAKPYGDGLINRGLAAWRDPKAGRPAACALTLYEATLDARLVAVDAATGHLVRASAPAARSACATWPATRAGEYHMTSPPIALDGLVVVGSTIDDNARTRHAVRGGLRLRRENRQAALVVGAVAGAQGRLARHLEHRRRQRLVGAERGPGPPPGAGPHRQRQPRLLGRPQARRQPLGQIRWPLDVQDRQAEVGFPARPPRPLGLRHRRGAHADLASRS